jgi:hypothetical protein
MTKRTTVVSAIWLACGWSMGEAQQPKAEGPTAVSPLTAGGGWGVVITFDEDGYVDIQIADTRLVRP